MNFKYCAPNRLNKAEYGSIWTAIISSEGDVVKLGNWIQCSQGDDMEWMKLGDFLAIAYDDKICNTDFIKASLAGFEKNKKR